MILFSANQGVLIENEWEYAYNGGCATALESYPAKIKSQKEDSIESCYELCKQTHNCKYFEYDSSAYKLCHLHPDHITRGNGYPNVKCYRMVAGTHSFYIN